MLTNEPFRVYSGFGYIDYCILEYTAVLEQID